MSRHQLADLSRLKSSYDERYAQAGEAQRALDAARAAREQARRELAEAIAAARERGATWREIGAALEVSPQAASRMYERARAAADRAPAT